ncbi:MAG: hypothetical protein JXA07_13275 [Spirochaetes bacterium]|nr:hypothetical protein [Spirochaetota bacterium]
MKVKIIFAVLIAALMLISIAQIFPIPPHAGDVFSLYRSGYFSELDREFGIITDSFLGIKSMARPEYAWIFLEDVGVKHNIGITVYDYRGYRVAAPGEKTGTPDREVLQVMNSLTPKMHSEIRDGRYFSIIPLIARGDCRFCHTKWNNREVVGALSFERDYDAMIYYSSERKIIFIILTMLLGGLLYAVVLWDPGKNIKELFDK